MITPAEIRKKAERQYSTFLAAALTRERFFPFQIKGNKGKSSDSYEKLFKEIKRLLESEKQKIGYGYTVSLKEVNTKQAGKISMPDSIFFENVEDYIKFIDKEKEFLAFRKAVRQTHKQVPELKKWMAEQPLKVIKHLDIWEDMLHVCSFFIENPKSNLYAREIPTPTVATFIENNQKILTELLAALLPNTNINDHFEKQFGLKYDAPLVRIRSLNGMLENFPIADISLKIEDWQKVNLEFKTVFIITDVLNFLRFPDQENAIAILGTAEALVHLDQFDFLKNAQIYFWGDLNLQSAAWLSSIRAKFPNTKSFLMEIELLEVYEEVVENVKITNTEIITHLTPKEQALLTELRKGKELLQKHIRQEDIEIALENDRQTT
jgi:hypothetical protein